MNGLIDGWGVRCMNEWLDGWMHEWMEGEMDG